MGNNLHPFVLNEIDLLRKAFDEVYLICLKASCGFDEIEQYSNVHVYSISLMRLYSKVWLFFPELFSGYFWKDVHIAINNHIADFKYCKTTVMYSICGRYFARVASRIIDSDKESKWFVESYWLSGPACAAAHVKKKYPNVTSFSRLHSAEADYIRNKYSICQYKYFLEKYLDYIFFVSNKGKQQYQWILKEYYNKEIDNTTRIVNYLGVKKNNNTISPKSTDGIFRIVSCSRVTPLKRVELLASVFSQWKEGQIQWTHIGGGEGFNGIESIIAESNHGAANCILLGNCSNEKVLSYYQNNHIDAFINISTFEGLPVSIMEALSYGIPIIATDAGGTKELVDERNGILLKNDLSAEDIIHAVQLLIEMNEKDYDDLKRGAYQVYHDKLRANSNYEKLLLHINAYTIGTNDELFKYS